MKKQLTTFILDFITIPALFMSNKKRAQYHLKFVCPHCPKWRRTMTDVEGIGDCYWHYNWKNENYNIPRHFGIKNWILRLIFLKTNLTNYNKSNLP